MNAPSRPARFNLEAEQALLGAILIQNDAFGAVVQRVSPEDFYVPEHREIFAEIGRLIGEGRVATPVTLKDKFPNIKLGDEQDSPTVSQYLARLCAEATTIINAPDYARTVRDLSTIRAIIGIASDLERAPSHLSNSDEALRNAFERIDAIRASIGSAEEERASIGAIARALAERMRSDEPGADASISTGLADLDRALGGGYRAGRLLVFAGRPGAGKTVLMVSSGRRVARRPSTLPQFPNGNGVLIFSLEMPRADIMARFAADELAHTNMPIDYRDILVGNLDEYQRHRVIEAAQALEPLPIIVDTTVGLSMFEIAARARIVSERWAKQGIKLGLIAIDYLGLIKTGDRYRGNRVHELGETARAAKVLCGQLSTCGMLLAQLNRSVESREDKRPLMQDLRDSGEVEEHADVVGLLYRPAYYDQRDPKVRAQDPEALAIAEARRYRLELGLDKNRLGPTITVPLWCDVAKSSVDNVRHYA